MHTKDLKVAVIGTGNMGQALLGGMLRVGITKPELVVASDADPVRLKRVSDEYGVRTVPSNLEAVKEAEVVLLAVKPQNLPEIHKELHGRLNEHQAVISILAGVTEAKLLDAFGEGPTIVRVMPNLPALIGEGMSVIADVEGDPELIEMVKVILETVGEVIILPEKYMDAVTALSGTGPGFLYYCVEMMARGGEAIGLPREAARWMAKKTVIGASHLLEKSGETPEELRFRVTSPGGTTEAGIKALEQHEFGRVFQLGLEAAARRSEELGKA